MGDHSQITKNEATERGFFTWERGMQTAGPSPKARTRERKHPWRRVGNYTHSRAGRCSHAHLTPGCLALPQGTKDPVKGITQESTGIEEGLGSFKTRCPGGRWNNSIEISEDGRIFQNRPFIDPQTKSAKQNNQKGKTISGKLKVPFASPEALACSGSILTLDREKTLVCGREK